MFDDFLRDFPDDEIPTDDIIAALENDDVLSEPVVDEDDMRTGVANVDTQPSHTLLGLYR